MARGVWISDEERDKILQMRKDGVPVSSIAKQIERSTNFIYRILKKNGFVSKTTQKAPAVCQPSTLCDTLTPATITVSKTSEVGAGRDRLMQDLSDSSAALLCAVENMEVSSYEPITMSNAAKGFEKQRSHMQQSRPGNVDASVAFDTAPTFKKSRNSETQDEFWLMMDAPVSMAQSLSSNISDRHQVQTQLPAQPLKKKLKTTSIATSQELAQTNAQSSSLLMNLQSQPPQLTRQTTTDNADRINGLLTRIQDEIRRLEGSALSDSFDAQLQQILVKVHADILLNQLQKTFSGTEYRKFPRDVDPESKETGQLLRKKLAEEISLLKVQTDRERLELERIRHITKPTASTSVS